MTDWNSRHLTSMAHKPNGRVVDSKLQKTMADAKIKTRSTRRKGFRIVLLGMATRLLTWYSIMTILFRCPSTLPHITDESPRLCKPYVQVRDAVLPHLTPYYHTYAAPYVNLVQPYYQALDAHVVGPVTMLGAKYGAPRVAQLQQRGQAQWEKSVQPRVNQAGAVLHDQYAKTMAPYVAQASAASAPYVALAKESAFQTYYGHLLPTYHRLRPYAVHAYTLGAAFAVDTAYPSLQWAWEVLGTFVNRSLLPRARILYGENVEPQLLRIRERLGSYRDGRKVQAVVHEFESPKSLSESSISTASLSTASPVSSETHVEAVSVEAVPVEAVPVEEVPVATPLTREEKIAKAQEIVTKDLQVWQEKFSMAAEEGSQELDVRIADMTDRLIRNQAQKVGPSLIIELQEAIQASNLGLKRDILALVASKETIDDEDAALALAIRQAGTIIRDKAKAVRTWRHGFDQETHDLVERTVQETLRILDGIADLCLQEVGMRWAWTDGITHKDWAQYHALKPKFSQWRHQVERVAHDHAGIAQALTASQEIEDAAMELAAEAARELGRLKQTGRWKLSTGDVSDDWETKVMPAPIANAVHQASEAVVGSSSSSSSPGTMESLASAIHAAPEGVANMASAASDVVMGQAEAVFGQAEADSGQAEAESGQGEAVMMEMSSSPSGVDAKEASSAASETAESVITESSTLHDHVETSSSAKVWGGVDAQFVAASQIIFDDPDSDPDTTNIPQAIAAAARSMLSGAPPPGAVESIQSVAASRLSEGLHAASAYYESVRQAITATPTPAPVRDRLLDQAQAQYYAGIGMAHDRYTQFLAAASSAVMPTSTTPPVHESLYSQVSEHLVGTPAPAYQSALDAAMNQYAQVSAAAMDHLSVALVSISHHGKSTAVLQASASSLYSVAVAEASSIYAQASSTLSVGVYGTPPPWSDAVASAASSNWEALLTAASSQVYGAPTPTYIFVTEQVKSYASSVAAQVTAVASHAGDEALEQYAALQDLISELAFGHEADFTESVYNRFSSAYHTVPLAAASSASSLASEAYESASSVIAHVWTAPPAVETILQAANAALDDAVQAASIHVYGEQKGAYEQATSSAAAVFEAMQASASARFLGTHVGYAEAAASSVAAAASSAQHAISEAMYGTTAGPLDAVTSVVSGGYAQASEVVFGRQEQEQERGALESAQARLSAAVEQAQLRLAELASMAGEGASEAASEAVDRASRLVDEATQKIKDEL